MKVKWNQDGGICHYLNMIMCLFFLYLTEFFQFFLYKQYMFIVKNKKT